MTTRARAVNVNTGSVRKWRRRPAGGNVDADDLARFEAIGAAWWDEDGPMKALHRLNPLRIGYLRDLLASHFGLSGASGLKPLAGLAILDIGCGAGLLAEPLARLGATLTGIDPGHSTIAEARAHAHAQGLAIDYQVIGTEGLAGLGRQFDAVLAMEVVEHVTNMGAFLRQAAILVRPGGLFVASTLNRTLKSFALAIVGAEYVLGWLPIGTHQWDRFVTPKELTDGLVASGLSICDRTGVVYQPLRDAWRLSGDMDVNYMIAAERRP
jgi:2-polyprenyl-6-hydroxyphenyl methylase/3-demethylubiquinone-9 3-methyltransferase